MTVSSVRLLKLIFFSFWYSLVNANCQTLNKDNQQYWLNFIVDKQFNSDWLIDTELAYNNSFSPTDGWSELAFTPIIENYYLRNIDLLGGFAFSLVNQDNDLNSFETRLITGARHHVTPLKRFYFRHLLRYESRFFWYSDETSSVNGRTRYRLELITSLTEKNYYQPTNMYLITDYEFYFNFDDGPNERYMFQNRARIGLGYKPNSRWKFEYIFIRQQSKNNLDTNEPLEINYIHRFMIKFYPSNKKG